jgi:hypothetical protein
VLSTSKYKVGVLVLRIRCVSSGKGLMEIGGSAQDSVGQTSYPGVLTHLAQAVRKNNVGHSCTQWLALVTWLIEEHLRKITISVTLIYKSLPILLNTLLHIPS